MATRGAALRYIGILDGDSGADLIQMQGLVEGPGTCMRAAHQYSRILGRYLGLRRSLNRSREIDAYLVKQSPFCCTGGHLYAHQSLQKSGITGLEAGLNGVQDRGTIQISLSERLQTH